MSAHERIRLPDDRGRSGIHVPIQNGRSKWPRGTTPTQKDIPNHLRIRLPLGIAREPDATCRTSDRERDDLAGRLTRFDACREKGTVGQVRAREERVVYRAARLNAHTHTIPFSRGRAVCRIRNKKERQTWIRATRREDTRMKMEMKNEMDRGHTLARSIVGKFPVE